MAIWDYAPKTDMTTTLAIGAGLLVAPFVLSLAWSGVRPLLKGLMKGSITVYEKGHELVADAVEGTGNLIEEARSEALSELSARNK